MMLVWSAYIPVPADAQDVHLQAGSRASGRPWAESTRVLLPAGFVPDPAAVERRKEGTRAWYEEMLTGSYDRSGSRNPRWDPHVREGLAALTLTFALVPDRPGDARDRARVAFDRALEAGCDDPLVTLLAAELHQTSMERRAAAERVHRAAMTLEASTYPAYWRGYGLIVAGAAMLNAGRGLPADEWAVFWRGISYVLDRALTLYPAVLKDRDIPDDVALSYINSLATTFVKTSRKDRAIVEQPAVEAVRASRGHDDPLLPLLRAWFALNSGWDARGTDFARKVPDEAWPIFHARLAEAEAHVAEAVALGSSDPAIPAVMIRVGIGLYGDTQELDAWFRHGIEVEPGDAWWYEARLDWLMPKWYGSREQVLTFGRELVAQQNWSLRLPLLLEWAWKELDGGALPLEACPEVLEIHRAFVERHPDSPFGRAAQAKAADACRGAFPPVPPSAPQTGSGPVASIAQGLGRIDRSVAFLSLVALVGAGSWYYAGLRR